MTLSTWTGGAGILLGIAAVLLLSSSAFGQAPEPSPAQLEGMERLAGWIGEWEGHGWAASGPGERTEFRVVESVRPKIQGSVLLVEGLGAVRGEDGTPLVVHEALALLSYDEGSGRYGWRSYDLRGGVIDTELEVTDEGLEWGFRHDDGPALLRFTIRLSDDRWDEVGHVSLDDGRTWHRMLEMTLTRVGPDDR